jgi:glycosyltransferase involved in cell wall biosynthesis
MFDALDGNGLVPPKIAFVGTFDYRKGASEFPELVRRLVNQIPAVTFRLIGTRGMFPTEHAVLQHFPRQLRAHIEVIPSFRPDDLPALLAPCSLGVFPSYMEGFSFGMLEMMAASLPVIAYDAPGAPMMLPPEFLVPKGDVAELSRKVIALLLDPEELARTRKWAREQSQGFSWERAARRTAEAYGAAIQRRESSATPNHVRSMEPVSES